MTGEARRRFGTGTDEDEESIEMISASTFGALADEIGVTFVLEIGIHVSIYEWIE